MWRRKRADELIKTIGDPEAPHLYRNTALRKAKQQYNDKILGLATKNVYTNLHAMKYDSRFEGAVRTIGMVPVSVHYRTQEQMAVFEKYPGTLYIDATGSVIKKITLPNGELCPHVYLYQAVGQVGSKMLSIFQMVSAVQNTNAISFWLNEFCDICTRRTGRYNSKEVPAQRQVPQLSVELRNWREPVSSQPLTCDVMYEYWR